MKSYNLEVKKIKEIGNLIKNRRLEKNISISTLAEKLDINPGYITKIEQGTNTKSINILLLNEICKELGLDYFQMLKNLGYIERNVFILVNEDLENISNIADSLRDKLGDNDETYNKYIDLISKLINESYEKNIKKFDSLNKFSFSNEINEFVIESCLFKEEIVKGFFTVEKKDSIKDKEYILVKINEKYFIKEIYFEKQVIILEDPSHKVKPIIIENLNNLNYFGTLNKIIKVELF